MKNAVHDPTARLSLPKSCRVEKLFGEDEITELIVRRTLRRSTLCLRRACPDLPAGGLAGMLLFGVGEEVGGVEGYDQGKHCQFKLNVMKPRRKSEFLPDRIESLICHVRDEKVILAGDLAKIYGVETRTLNQAVKRNKEKFPDDFMFQLTPKEASRLAGQTSSTFPMLSQNMALLWLPMSSTANVLCR